MTRVSRTSLPNVDILWDDDLIAGYTRGWRGEQGSAEFVARPRTTDAVSTLVAWSVQNRVQLVPQSARTGLVAASVPDDTASQAIVSLTGLQDTFSLNLVNRSLRCSAGYRLSQINELVSESGLFFPIDLSADPCVGGMVATNTGGSRLLRYGGVRENVLGLTVVLGDESGTIVELGSGWRKYSNGPDWKHLFIGTGAAFGIITECVLNLVRKPKHQAAGLLVLADESALSIMLEALERTFGTLLSACEFMSGAALKAAWQHVKHLRKPFVADQVPELVLLVEISCDWPLAEDDRSLDDLLLDGVSQIWGQHSECMSDAVFGRQEELWDLRHAISDGVKALGKLYAFDLSFERNRAFAFRKHMIALLAKHYPEILVCDFGHVGDGGIHFNLIDQTEPEYLSLERETDIRDLVIRTAVEEFQGCFSAEHGVGPVNQKYFDKYTVPKQRLFASALEAVTSRRNLGRVHFGQSSLSHEND